MVRLVDELADSTAPLRSAALFERICTLVLWSVAETIVLGARFSMLVCRSFRNRRLGAANLER